MTPTCVASANYLGEFQLLHWRRPPESASSGRTHRSPNPLYDFPVTRDYNQSATGESRAILSPVPVISVAVIPGCQVPPPGGGWARLRPRIGPKSVLDSGRIRSVGR